MFDAHKVSKGVRSMELAIPPIEEEALPPAEVVLPSPPCEFCEEPPVVGAEGVVMGVTPPVSVVGEFCIGPEPTFIDTTEMHVGCPGPGDESSVISIGRVPSIGVVAISTCIRSVPDGDTRRVMKWNGMKLPPTLPAIATYEALGTVNSNELRALSYI